ncbi:hypothetical protein WCX72_09810 [Sulfurimonas sp. HSL1-6]|uniref:hypothetical protein n=1 Tax=Thiomicrolovo immobilis TaxID=3131935 RepID=UPI0031F8EABC
MTPKEAWDSYAASCKKAGIKPGPYRNLLENEDEPKKKRRDGIAAASAQQRKENMAKQKRLGNLEIAEALGIRLDQVGPLKDLAGISRQGPIMESRLEELRKYLDALPPMQQEEQPQTGPWPAGNEFMDEQTAMEVHGNFINHDDASAHPEPPYSIEEHKDGEEDWERIAGYEDTEHCEAAIIDAQPIEVPEGTAFAEAGLENTFVLSKGQILEIIAAAKEEARAEIVMPQKLNTGDVMPFVKATA